MTAREQPSAWNAWTGTPDAWLWLALVVAFWVGMGVITWSATHPPAPQPPAVVQHDDGPAFLPIYLGIISGRLPYPADDCPPAHDLRSLLIPCDTR